MNEKEKLLLLSQGSNEAFEHMYYLYSGKLYNFIMKLTQGNNHVAEELVQRTFIKIWEQQEKVDPEKSFLSFLCTIAKNLLLNDYEHEAVRFIYAEYIRKSENLRYDNVTEKDIDRKLLEDLIDQLTEDLPPRRKEIFVLSRKYGYSNKSIARKLHLSESTIETQLTKSLAYMKDKLKYYSSYVIFLYMFFYF
ncbi:RNA polymerase sigma-70 factor [Dysgonomonas termitidis]|uniref:RNA polymerase sigma factor n=1 Tax=Dysgonomonas termitidis TaxID=1516126 RepID=A0ABV9L640_9BACT